MGPGVWRSFSVFNVLSRTHYTDYTLQETCVSLESDMNFKRICCSCLNSYLLWKFSAHTLLNTEFLTVSTTIVVARGGDLTSLSCEGISAAGR